MISKQPYKVRYIAGCAGAFLIFPIWEAWPLTSLAGLQVAGFVGGLIGSALAGALGGWLWWKYGG